MAFTNEYSLYPNDIDGYSSLPLLRNTIDEILAQDHNRLRDAIVKIEQELGIKPSGTYASVVDRLNDIGDASTTVAAHLLDTTDAHDASAVSVADASDYFAGDDVESIIDEIAMVLPIRPDYIGENVGTVPNSGIPSFVDGYGTKFIYNISDWSGETSDTPTLRTQPRGTSGIRGIHILEVSSTTTNSVGFLVYDLATTTLTWQAPGDASPGTGIDVSGMIEGDEDILLSSTTTKALRFVRTGAVLPATSKEELFEIYRLDTVSGCFTMPGRIMPTNYITRTATSSSATSRNQFVITGTIYPADKGKLVLQRKLRSGSEFFPIAVLDLGVNFVEVNRATGQDAYVPTLSGYDTITLYDRLPMKNDYSSYNNTANGSDPYDVFTYNYNAYQLAKYMIPVSNSDIVSAELSSPADSSVTETHDKVSAYRVVHYRAGITDYTGDPSSANIYSVVDYFGSGSDADNTIRFSNLYVDPGKTRPGITGYKLRPDSGNASVIKAMSGIRYYNSSSDLFNVEVRGDDNVFSNTYLKTGILNFVTNVFNFPDGYSVGTYGASVDVTEIFDDGYNLFSDANPPEHTETCFYVANGIYNSARKIYPAPSEFSVKAYYTATFSDPFGAGDGYTAYGDQFDGIERNKILINTYGSRSTAAKEYFTDEDYRIGETEEFIDDGTTGEYVYPYADEWLQDVPLGIYSLQCGARFATADRDTCGLIYPQDDYSGGSCLPRQYGESFSGGVWTAPTVPSYDGYNDQDKYYHRLFSLGYPVSSFKLRIVSAGSDQVAFDDISYYNASRFGKIEIKVPGSFTGWLDITRLYETGKYLGACAGLYTGTTGDFTVPVTLGNINNADSGNMIAVRVTYFGNSAPEIAASKLRIITMLELLPQ